MPALEEMSSENVTMIIPAAGFGRRVGSPLSKEMLVLEDSGQPLIENSLNIALLNCWKVCIATRKEKTNLLAHLKKWSEKIDIKIQFIENSKEWPDTILQTAPHWTEKNIMILPDTRWSAPTQNELATESALVNSLDSYSCAYATFSVDEPQFWGNISSSSPQSMCQAETPPQANARSKTEASGRAFSNLPLLKIAEKPKHILDSSFKAWGLVAFRKSAGEKLWTAHLQSTLENKEIELNLDSIQFPLASFIDLTR